jgi:hypothetical protein
MECSLNRFTEASRMRNAVVCCLALLFALAVRPAAAGDVYIPIVERNGANGAVHNTEIWISNGGQVTRSFVTAFLLENTDGVKRSGVVDSARVRIGTNGSATRPRPTRSACSRSTPRRSSSSTRGSSPPSAVPAASRPSP